MDTAANRRALLPGLRALQQTLAEPVVPGKRTPKQELDRLKAPGKQFTDAYDRIMDATPNESTATRYGLEAPNARGLSLLYLLFDALVNDALPDGDDPLTIRAMLKVQTDGTLSVLVPPEPDVAMAGGRRRKTKKRAKRSVRRRTTKAY